jgi:TolB-like protein/class 3 adenylate cyclase
MDLKQCASVSHPRNERARQELTIRLTLGSRPSIKNPATGFVQTSCPSQYGVYACGEHSGGPVDVPGQAPVERRLAAILAADVVGYSRLMGVDEVGTLRALKAIRRDLADAAIADRRGRVVKTTGDGILIEFPSVVDAVTCAVYIQRAMVSWNASVPNDKRIVFRMGINIGDIIIEDEDIFGDGVIVAVRLEALCEPGGLCISKSARDQVRDKLPFNLHDLGEQEVKNIARPIRVFSLSRTEISELPEEQPSQAAELKDNPAIESKSRALPNKPSLAVLPFENLSGDPEQEYFADGIVEDITTALSRLSWLFVIARNSSFTYKGRPRNVKQVGELGVRYILEGSVRKAGNRVRVAGQLIDARTGAHLWADRFEGALQDIFDLQDQVTASVVGAITPKLEQAEIERATHKPTESLDAYDHYLRAMASYYRWTREGTDEALRLSRRAIELDPNFASAYGLAARCYCWCKVNDWLTDRKQDIADAERLARRAVELGKDDALALCSGGFALALVAGDLEGGATFIDRALLLNRNLALAWHFSGHVRIFLGEPEIAIGQFEQAMRLSPFDPLISRMRASKATALFFAGRYEEASSCADMVLREQSNDLRALRIAVVSNALAGRLHDARKALAHLRQIQPALQIAKLEDSMPLCRTEDVARYVEGMRKAGLS